MAGQGPISSNSVALRPDGYPRRCDVTLMTPAEKAICDAMQAVEAAGCDVLLTEAVNLLSQAREKVADFVDRGLVSAQHDARLGALVAEATEIIARTLPSVRSDELRSFIRKHAEVPGFKDLVFTLILIAEPEGGA